MTDRAELYEQLDTLVRELSATDAERQETVTDWVLIAGCQYYDDDGDRCGVVGIYPQQGSQPYFITAGLLTSAMDWLRHVRASEGDE